MLSPSPLVSSMVAARKGGGRTEGGRLAGEDSGPEGGSVSVFALGRPEVTPGPEFSAPSAEADRKYDSGKIRRDRRRSVLCSKGCPDSLIIEKSPLPRQLPAGAISVSGDRSDSPLSFIA